MSLPAALASESLPMTVILSAYKGKGKRPGIEGVFAIQTNDNHRIKRLIERECRALVPCRTGSQSRLNQLRKPNRPVFKSSG
eukprot:305490-Hanusia_phi.AAC.1